MAVPAEDLTGRRFGRLVVLSRAENGPRRKVRWLCQCDCGQTAIVRADTLKAGLTTSCGCVNGHAKDIAGQRFGRLVAIAPTSVRKRSSVVWECRCDCGGTRHAIVTDLLCGDVKSCGCLASEDLTGQVFGRLKVVSRTERRNPYQYVVYKCLCKCGKIKYVASPQLRNGGVRSCGCLAHEQSARAGQRLAREHVEQNIIAGSNIQALTRGIQRNNTSGVKGVSWSNSRQLWVAQIGFRRRKYVLGRYKKIEDAAAARKKAEAALHGEFLEWYADFRAGKTTAPPPDPVDPRR